MKRLAASLCMVFVLCHCVGARADNIFYFTSSPTSFIGHGSTRLMTPASGHTFSSSHVLNPGPYVDVVRISVQHDFPGFESWSLQLRGVNKSLATAGIYPAAETVPKEVAGKAGLDFSGGGAAIGGVATGSFVVLEASFDAAGNVQKYAVDFTQYDGVAANWSYGSVRFNSDIPINVPEPSTFALLAIGGIGICLHRKRRLR